MNLHSFAVKVAESERLDSYLSQNIEEISRSQIQKLIQQGLVQVNDCVCTEKKTVVKVGDRLILEIPEIKPLNLEPQSIPLEILYEDEHLLVINKPVGLVVHPAPGHSDRTLVNALLAHCPNLSGINGVQRPGIVHRLDKDTSGAIVVAKTDLAHQSLQSQIQAKTAKREYLGIVNGAPKTLSGTVNAPIGRHRTDRKKMAVVENGRSAITHWEVQERLGNYTLVKFDLETGRTHQIRVHAAYIGHAIAGDPVYSRGISQLHGQALHAWRLSFTHPVSGELIVAIAPAPVAYTKFLTQLRKFS
jgi:23S rRNA pseudouridine1911/1915/1917 synthase